MGRVNIHMITPEAKIALFFSECSKAVDNIITRHMKLVGELCVKRVRDRKPSESWIDRTGNLRSSIGYAILRDGKMVDNGGFNPTNAPKGGGEEGVTKGRNYLEKIIRFYHDNYTLVVVAGMNYAEEVEAIEGKDVLASTELWARAEWEKSMSGLKQKIQKEIETIERKYGL